MSEEPEQPQSGPSNSSPGKGSEPPPRHRHLHRRALLLIWLGSLALLMVLAMLQVQRYLESPQTHERVRRYAIKQLERATGGRVELDRVDWNLLHLEFELVGLRIHGTEAAGQPPLLQVERAQGQLKWTELLAGRLKLHQLQVQRPLAHVEVRPDGSTNFPGVEGWYGAARPGTSVELLHLAVERAQLVEGRLDWNDKTIPLDGVASGVFVQLGYRPRDAHNDAHYEGTARVGQVRMQTPQVEPLILGADARFRLYHDRVEVPWLRISQGNSWAEASGFITGLASPVVLLSYRASADAAELARLVHYRELRGGSVQLSGQANYRWDRGEYAAVGKAQASGVAWSDEILRLEKINGGFIYTLDRERFSVSALFASALGGTVHGSMNVSHLPGLESVGQVHLEVTGVELDRALAAFSSAELPLQRLPMAGSTTGTLEVGWRGSPLNARLEGDLRVQPQFRSGQLPVSAVVQAGLDFKDQSAQVHRLEANARGTHLSAQGRLSRSSNLSVELTASSLAELAPTVNSWRGSREQDLPVEFSGSAAFRGRVQGRLESPTLAGSLELHDFVTSLRIPPWQVPGAPPSPRLRTRWDSLQGQVQYSAAGESVLKGVLRRSGATISLDASVGLANGNYDWTLPFAARIKMVNVETGDLQKLVSSTYPVTGRVSGELQVSGASGHLSGTGRVAMKDGTAWQQAVRSAAADVSLTENEARLRHIVIKSDAMQLTGEAQINVTTREFGFDLKGSEVRLESLRALALRGIALRGQAAFEASGQGTPDAPVINGQLHLRNLAIGSQALGAMDVEAVTHGSEMSLSARSNFSGAEAKLDGQVHLRGSMPMHLSGDLRSANLNALLNPYLPVPLSGTSGLAMHVDASGEAMHLRDLTAAVVIDHLASGYGGIAVVNEGPIRLSVEHQVLRIDQFRLSGEQGTRFLAVRGQVQLGGRRQINLRADGSVNLRLLEPIYPQLRADGAANLNLQVNGTLAQPSMHGRLNVVDGSFSDIDFPNGLSNINGSLAFNEDRVQLEDLTARTGGGLLHCSGFLTYLPSQGLDFNLSLTGHEIRLRYPEGLSSTAEAALTLSGTGQNMLLSGSVTVTRLGINQQFDVASYLNKGIRSVPVQMSDSPLNRVRMDVHVTSTQELQLETSLARLTGSLDLHLRGSLYRPVLLGRIDLLEGTLDFNGTKYRMERGDVRFTNPVRIEPIIDIELSARVRDYELALGFHGSLDRMTTSYRSDPPLSSSDIISLLALGRTGYEQANPAIIGTAQYRPAVSESASNSLLGQALSANQNSRVQKLFGASRVKIDPNVGEANAGLARVTVEQQISNKLTLTYISNLNQAGQEIIQGEYNLQKDLSVVAVRDQDGVVSFVLVIRRRRK